MDPEPTDVPKEADGPAPAQDKDPEAADAGPSTPLDAEPAARLPPVFKKPAPPPKFAASGPPKPAPSNDQLTNSSPRSAEEQKRAAAVAAAAAAAAASSTPAQRERAIAEAAAKAFDASQRAGASSSAHLAEASTEPNGAAAEAGPPKEAATYTPPEWAGAPAGLPFSLEVMKNGAILETRDVSAKDHYTFGRSPANDFHVEHPSASRLHAVLQFKGDHGEAFVYDAGSTHGTFLNKKRLRAKAYAPFRVGDILRFGQSTRMYIFNGSTELMPEEGLTRQQRQTLRALEAKEARQEREAQIAKAQMEAALHRGVRWGMGEDAEEEPGALDAPQVDWRAYSSTHGLSEKQTKLADKIRKWENRIRNLQTETDRIKAKQTEMNELTAGQATQMARNEAEVDRLTEELDDLEESLNESIADALGHKLKQAAVQQPKKRRRRGGDDDDDLSGDSSGEDQFYDRTVEGVKKRRKEKAAVEDASSLYGKKHGDASSLYGKKEALIMERTKLQEQLALEEALVSELPRAGGQGGAEAAPATAEVAADPLDAFMSNVETQIELDKVGALKKEIAELDSQITETERLLKFADPDGYFRAGTKAAEDAKAKGIKALAVERQRQEAAEQQRKARLAAKAAAAAHFEPEHEEHDVVLEPAGASTTGRPASGPGQPNGRKADTGGNSGGLEVRQKPKPGPKGLGGLSREQVAARLQDRGKPTSTGDAPAEQGAAPAAGPSSSILQDLAALANARQAAAAREADQDQNGSAGAGAMDAGWQPPTGQTGDGRTSLNDKLVY
ncbi:hypothetical protein WJX72_006586 [[Myrmecia] bisecta]|uniref:FHA domain-containing protein n=1 Tax=[Myrmecia] bisecta TaxID=41462 RepID=A0AAW1PCQ3_9CHLO